MCMLCTPVLTQMLIQGTMPLKAKSSSFLYGTNTPKQTNQDTLNIIIYTMIEIWIFVD